MSRVDRVMEAMASVVFAVVMIFFLALMAISIMLMCRTDKLERPTVKQSLTVAKAKDARVDKWAQAKALFESEGKPDVIVVHDGDRVAIVEIPREEK
jgi:maltose-binding protein MalE